MSRFQTTQEEFPKLLYGQEYVEHYLRLRAEHILRGWDLARLHIEVFNNHRRPWNENGQQMHWPAKWSAVLYEGVGPDAKACLEEYGSTSELARETLVATFMAAHPHVDEAAFRLIQGGPDWEAVREAAERLGWNTLGDEPDPRRGKLKR